MHVCARSVAMFIRCFPYNIDYGLTIGLSNRIISVAMAELVSKVLCQLPVSGENVRSRPEFRLSESELKNAWIRAEA